MKNLIIIMDAAHGVNVAGKQSPAGDKEYQWSRKVCGMLTGALLRKGFMVHQTVTTDMEPGLSARVRVANQYPGDKKLLISLHNNAAGMGDKWMNARGPAIYTSPGQTKSDTCATQIWEDLKKNFPELKFNRVDMSDGDADYEEKFTVLMGSKYMAVLLEWLFQDNKEDIELIKNDAMNERLVSSLVESIEKLEVILTT